MSIKSIQTQIINSNEVYSIAQTSDRICSHFFEDEFKNVSNVMEELLNVRAN